MPEKRVQEGFRRPNTAPPVTAIYRMFSPEGMAKGHEPHYHPDTMEVCFVARGTLDWWVGDDAFEIHPGDALAIPPGRPHGSVDSTLQPCEYYAVHFAPDELPPSVAAALEGFGGRCPRRPEIGTSIRALLEEHRAGGALFREVVAARAVLLLADLTRPSEPSRRTTGLVRRAQALLREGGTTVEEVADRVGVSTVWLTRLFREELGESPGEWLRAQRLAQAKRLLASDRASVTEIAVRLGFSSSQSFATAFRHECGLTPSAYRAASAPAWSRRSVAARAPMR